MEDHILHVQMLGGFSMEYNGKRLASEKTLHQKVRSCCSCYFYIWMTAFLRKFCWMPCTEEKM